MSKINIMIQVSYQVIDDQKIRISNNANNESEEIISNNLSKKHVMIFGSP